MSGDIFLSMSTWWLLDRALQMELGHRPLLEEPCPLHSATRNGLPCTLHQNSSHYSPRIRLTRLRHCRSSYTIMFLLIETLLAAVQGVLLSTCPEYTPTPLFCCKGKPTQPGLAPLFLGVASDVAPILKLSFPAAVSVSDFLHWSQSQSSPTGPMLVHPQPIILPRGAPRAVLLLAGE